MGINKIVLNSNEIMPPKHKISTAIKEAKFFKALVDTGGNAKEAYKATVPQVKGNSAATLGSRELSKIDSKDIDKLYETIGCTKSAVLAQLWERMKNTNTQQYVAGTRVLSKIAGWETKSNGLRDLLDRDLDLIEVVKIRLKKRNDTNELRNVIDVDNTLVNSKSNETATDNNNSDEKPKQ